MVIIGEALEIKNKLEGNESNFSIFKPNNKPEIQTQPRNIFEKTNNDSEKEKGKNLNSEISIPKFNFNKPKENSSNEDKLNQIPSNSNATNISVKKMGNYIGTAFTSISSFIKGAMNHPLEGVEQKKNIEYDMSQISIIINNMEILLNKCKANLTQEEIQNFESGIMYLKAGGIIK